MPDPFPDDPEVLPRARRFSTGLALLMFGFGIAAGFLLAFSGLGFLEDSAGVIAGVFLVALAMVTLIGAALFLLRRPITRRLFGIAEAQVELFAGPLAEVAEGAATRDAARATRSARRLIEVAIARYAWLATRRWIVTSLVALIAAMAALAGTALLFKQNTLIEAQSTLLAEQNRRIAEQTALVDLQVQLAEAARNANLAVEITEIAAALGEASDRAEAGRQRNTEESGGALPEGSARLVPLLDPETDLPRSLIYRIAAASQAARPYRFLDIGLNPADETEKLASALALRRHDLPGLYARLTGLPADTGPEAWSRLVDRPASPERGQLLRLLSASGVQSFEVLNFFGLDLSFAHAAGITLPLRSMQMARLSYADLSDAALREVDLRGADLANARFRRADLRGVSFGRMSEAEARPPMSYAGAVTNMAGVDFSEALLMRVGLDGINGLALRFDGAVLEDVDLSGANIGAASFRGAVLLGVRLDGAFLASVEFDGALIAGPEPLAFLAEIAAPGSFRPDRFAAEPVSIEEAMGHPVLFAKLEPEEVAAWTQKGLWRLRRIAAFEDPAP